MKKLMLALAALAGIATITATAAEFNWKDLRDNVSTSLYQNRTALDQNVVSTALEYLDTIDCKNDDQKLGVIRYRVIAYDQTTGADRTVAGLKKYADGLIASAKFEKPLTGAQYASIFSIWWRQNESEFAQEVYALMKSTPGAEKFPDMGLWANAVGRYEEAFNIYVDSKKGFAAVRAANIAIHKLNDPAKAFAAAKIVAADNCQAAEVRQVLNIVVNKLTGDDAIKAADMKAFLQNLNRRYTAKLVEDEKTWEPVISQVRTLLEAY